MYVMSIGLKIDMYMRNTSYIRIQGEYSSMLYMHYTINIGVYHALSNINKETERLLLHIYEYKESIVL